MTYIRICMKCSKMFSTEVQTMMHCGDCLPAKVQKVQEARVCRTCGKVEVQKPKLVCPECQIKRRRAKQRMRDARRRRMNGIIPKPKEKEFYPPRKDIITHVCTYGVKQLARMMIVQALRDNDFGFIMSSRADLYLDLLEVDRRQILAGYDENLLPVDLADKYRPQTDVRVRVGALEIDVSRIQDMTIKEMAQIAGVNNRTIRNHLNAGKSKLEVLQFVTRSKDCLLM